MPPASNDDLGPLGESLGFRLRVAQNAILKQSKEAYANLGLQPQEYGLLLLVGYKAGRVQRAVADALRVRDANLVAMIDRLEALDLVNRRPAPQDGRSHTLHLTNGGRALLRRAKQIEANLCKQFDKKLGKGGRARLVKLLTRLVALK
jgi:DNA-binding MarR family transcriptional regulator